MGSGLGMGNFLADRSSKGLGRRKQLGTKQKPLTVTDVTTAASLTKSKQLFAAVGRKTTGPGQRLFAPQMSDGRS